MQKVCDVPSYHGVDTRTPLCGWLSSMCRLFSSPLVAVLLSSFAVLSFVADGASKLTADDVQALRFRLADKMGIFDPEVEQRLSSERKYQTNERKYQTNEKTAEVKWPPQIQDAAVSSEATERRYRPEFVGKNRLRFRLLDMDGDESPVSALLHVTPRYIKQFWPSHVGHPSLLSVVVDGLFSPAPADNLQVHTKVEELDSEVFLNGDNDVCKLDVLPAVRRWVESGRAGSGAVGGELRLRLEAGPDFVGEDGFLRNTLNTLRGFQGSITDPFLQIAFAAKRGSPSLEKRERRQTNPRPVGPGICARRQILVDVEEIGWKSFLIYPKVFNMTYCVGDCTFPFQIESSPSNAPNNITRPAGSNNSTTLHAIFQSILHMAYIRKRDERLNVPPSCCAPLRYFTQDMLYLTYDSRTVIRAYDDLMVDECTCV